MPGSGAGHTIMTGVGTGTQSGRMRAAYGGDIYSGTSPYSYGTLYGASPVVGSGRPLSQGASWSSTALPAFPWSNGRVLGNGGAIGAGSTGVLGLGNRILNGLGIPSAGVGRYSGGVLGNYGTSGVLGSYGTGDPWLSGSGPSLVGSGLAGPNVGNVVIGGGGPGYLGSGLISPRVGNVVVGGAPGVGLYNAGFAGYSNVGMLGSGKKG